MSERRARRRPGENREHLIGAGLIEFGLFGYHGASTAAIARRADVPQPHVYTSFATKHALFLACWERVRAAALEARGLDGSGLDGRAPDDEHLRRFLFQAVAAACDPVLGDDLLPSLLELRSALGEDRFHALLRSGASELLGEGLTERPSSA